MAGHPPHGPKPGAAAGACPGKSCPPSPKPDNRIAHTAAGPAGWAELSALHRRHKTLWPAQLHQILATRLLSGKTPLKLLQRPRFRSPPQPRMLMLGSRESSAYPECNIATDGPPWEKSISVVLKPPMDIKSGIIAACGVGSKQTSKDIEKRSLAAAVRPKDGDQFTASRCKVKLWLFWVLSGRRSQIEFPTVEVDGVDEVLLIAETARRGLDPLNP